MLLSDGGRCKAKVGDMKRFLAMIWMAKKWPKTPHLLHHHVHTPIGNINPRDPGHIEGGREHALSKA